MEQWLIIAKNAVKSDASFAFELCQSTAEREQVTLEWVIETFISQFKQITIERRTSC